MNARRSGRAALGAAAAVLLAGCPSTGPLGPTSMTGYLIVPGPSTTVSAPLGVASALIATCPSPKVVVGGGYTTANEAAKIFESVPLADGTGWSVSVRNENVIGSSFSIVPVAICVDRPAGYQVVTGATSNLSTQQIAQVEARCPDATFNLIGGGVTSDDSQSQPFSSVAGTNSQPSWLATAKNNYPSGLPSNTSLRAFAICAPIPQVPGRVVVASTSATLGANSKTVGLGVACPPGTLVLSGGVTSAESPAGWFDSGPTPGGAGWTTSVVSPLLSGTTIHVTVNAICAAAK